MTWTAMLYEKLFKESMLEMYRNLCQKLWSIDGKEHIQKVSTKLVELLKIKAKISLQ